mgnify:CR=1 FL=1
MDPGFGQVPGGLDLIKAVVVVAPEGGPVRKNVSSSQLWWLMTVRFFMDYLAALQMLFTGQPANFRAVFQARWAYHKLKQQYPISTDHSSKAAPLIAKRSIVWDFYVRRMKK